MLKFIIAFFSLFLFTPRTLPQNYEYAWINGTPNGLPNSDTKLKSEIVWKNNLGTTLNASIITDSSHVFAAAKNGNVYCFDLDGKKIWETKTNETILSRPALSDSNLLAGTTEGDLISFDESTGRIIQTLSLGEPITSQLFTVNIIYNGQQTTGVVIGTSKGSLYCYDINSFEMIWENHSAKDSIETLPLLINDRIIYGCGDGNYYCVDASSGIINWIWEENKDKNISSALCQPVSNGKDVFVVSPDNSLYAIDLMLGRTDWKKSNIDAYQSIGINENKEYLFIKCLTDNFLILSSKNGKLIKKIALDFGTDETPSVPVEWKGNIIFGCQDGKIYLIGKDYNWQLLLFIGNSSIQNIYRIKDNTFIASSADGTIVEFNLVQAE